MQRLGGELVLSASDLNDFLACEHLTMLERDVAFGKRPRAADKPAQAAILAELGEEHERRYIDRLRSEGVQVVCIDRGRADGDERLAALRAQRDATVAAMRQGAPVIYQATFFDGAWLGHADILRRVERSSDLGTWSYEVEDTKLARSEKPYFLVQLCFYSACVDAIQGAMPEHMHVVLGDGSRRSFRVNEFAAYERFLRRKLQARVAPGVNGDASTYPFPCSHCRLCGWDSQCTMQRRNDDSLLEVAGLTRLQDHRLRAAAIPTLAALAGTDASRSVPDVRSGTLQKLARQARLQFQQRCAAAQGDPHPFRYELLPPDPKAKGPRGFALLPSPSPGDVFFDMEGDPFYDVAEGLEYLFGAYTHEGGFRAFWGCERRPGAPRDRLREKEAFEAFVDFVMERRAADPGMHVYHYANYERHKLQTLAQRHATREDEVDALLREERLVDLYRVVRQSLAVGQPGYGLKKMEPFYGGREAAAIAGGDESVVQFERWRSLRDGGEAKNAPERERILADIERYNAQDCESTARLLRWLHERRSEAETALGAPIPFFTGSQRQLETKKERDDPHALMKTQLRARLPDDFDPDDAGARTAPAWPFWLALHLLEYHWREEKPEWWAFYDRCDRYVEDPEELRDDGTAIIELEACSEPIKDARSLEYTMTFPAQECKVDDGKAWDPNTKDRTGDVRSIKIRDGTGTLTLRRGPSRTSLPLPTAIVVRDTFNAKALQAALARVASALLQESPPTRYRAAYDLLLALPPRFRSRPRGTDIQPAQIDTAALVGLTRDLDESYLFVQGPPGSGKTYQGARMIVRLLKDGFRVGVTSFSHKAVNNLLRAVDEAAHEDDFTFRGQRKATSDDDGYTAPPNLASRIENVKEFALGAASLYAGTSWAFAPEAMDQSLDYLFIDEAGQVALPNALAASTAARNVVLLGDPLQLPHVHHTSHPGGIGTSVLERLLGDEQRPVPPDRGVLLNRTWRMHADVCRFISEFMYEGKLEPVPACNRQRVDSPGPSGTGVRYLEIAHVGARVRSEEEARRIADEITALLKGTVTDSEGRTRPMRPDDIIVVTPYNSQRRCIEEELKRRCDGCASVRVGTVDKFQGQEAYVVFFSTANSSPEDAPRGVDFIFDRNRLNVAISRARALAVYVGSPALLDALASSIPRMRALAAGCALMEYGMSAAPQRQAAVTGTQLALTMTVPFAPAL